MSDAPPKFGKIEPNLTIPYYLMASYLYYIEDWSMWNDCEYDNLCKYIYDNYDQIEHKHKYLVDKDALRAGTAYHIRAEDYPAIVIGAARYYTRNRECLSGFI